MKQLLNPILFAILLFVIGCTPQKKESTLPVRTVISGKIQHTEVYPTSNEMFAEVVDFRDRKTVFKDSIQKDGSFKIIIYLYAAQDVKMRPLLDRILLHPGDSIFINIDFKDLGKVQFSGDRAESNQAFRKYLWSTAGTFSYYSSDKPKPEEYRHFCDSVRNKAVELQQQFIQKAKPSKEVIQWTTDYININYYKSLLSYPIDYFRGDTGSFQYWIETTSYFNFTDSLENNFIEFGHTIVNSDIYDLSREYGAYIVTKGMANYTKQRGASWSQTNQIVLENCHSPIFRQLILGSFQYQLLCSNFVQLFDESKNMLDSVLQVPYIRRPLFDFYDELKKSIEHPEISSKAILSKMGVEGKVMLDSIIAKNKGKVLLVDLWATWCGPCLEGMKASKEIMPRYANNDVEFIFICVNSTEENWKSTLSRLQIGGQHYYCSNDQSRDIRRGLGVEGIPHYLLINKQGNIVEDKCLGLNTPSTQDKIKKLLAEDE